MPTLLAGFRPAFYMFDAAKIAQISEIPSNSLIFLSCRQYHNGIVFLCFIGKEANRRVAGLLLIVA